MAEPAGLWRRRAARLGLPLAVAALALLPRFVESPYALHVLILLFLSTVVGESWNVIGGYAGQYSVGHAAYYGVGAYTTLLLLERAQLAPWLGVWAAAALAALVALVIGAICFRLRGPYFVLASIAVAEILRLAALNWKDLTHGAEGVLVGELPPLKLGGTVLTDFSSKVPFYYAGLALALLAILLNVLVERSRLGYYLRAIREDQDAACSLGIPLGRYKGAALVLSAVPTALAGGLYGLYVGFVDPGTVLGLDVSIQLVLVCIIGGLGTVGGPVVGSLVLVLLSEALRSNLLAAGLFRLGVREDSAVGAFLANNLAHAHALIYGVLLIVVILFMPEGVLGFGRALLARKRGGGADAAP